MDFQAIATAPIDWTGDGLVLGLFEEDFAEAGTLPEPLTALDEMLDGAIADLITEIKFKGKAHSGAASRVGRHTPVKKLILVGLGKGEKADSEAVRQAAAKAAKLAKAQKCATLGVALPTVGDGATTVQAIVEGMGLALYEDKRFKSKSKDEEGNDQNDESGYPQTVSLLDAADQTASIARAEQILSGVVLARQLVAAPPNEVTPITLAETAAAIAAEYGMELTILEKEECEKRGMGAFLGVAVASDLPPKFIHMIYKPEGTARKKLAIVGKGLTFDSGGLNLKGPGSGIETMKMDMGGAAATLGAAKALAQLKPDVELHFISAVTENMISGHAMRPGDILTASNGKTIEVNNTDAEGRLTLADALVYADALGVDAIVDLATLTGACLVALGNDIAGYWSIDDDLAAELKAAAQSSGEKLWQMPLEQSYFEGIKSPIADMKNTGPRPAGSITAALFLKEFVKKTKAWAHIDIAGPAWTSKAGAYTPVGATGYGVRLLVDWVMAA
ncbi:MAG: leucyl aminopeptidase [Synechococcales cyanobacterium RM1_1_8]|nr:leucyl aminopeptidase [Synechococcales cyanobacterium RM1_1_8]